VVVLVVGVVVLLLLLVRWSAATMEWWWSVSYGVVACMGDCWCGVVDVVCNVGCSVVVVYSGWVGGSGIGGGMFGVDIWIGVCCGIGGGVFGGGSMFVVVGGVVYGFGGGVVVFGHRFQLPSISLIQAGQSVIPA
jgi:hypothetical protein